LTYEVDIISQDRLALIQLFVKVAKTSLESANDSYLEFNSLILLDNIFQNLMPVPSYPNELLKVQKNQGYKMNPEDIIDILQIEDFSQEFEVTD